MAASARPASSGDRLAVEAGGIGVGVGGFAEPAELEIDRRDRLPALALLGILAQTGLDLGDHAGKRGLLDGGSPCGRRRGSTGMPGEPWAR